MNFTNEFKRIFQETVLPQFEAAANRAFNRARDYILTEVENHVVCRELREGTVPSSIVPSSSSSLFGFMGFDAGTDPVGELLDFLDANIEARFKARMTTLSATSSIILPTKISMRRAGLVLPWSSGTSWPEQIEKGVSGLKYYLEKEGYGLSDRGIQAKKGGVAGAPLQKVRNYDMPPVDFLSPIFSEAKRLAAI